MKNWKKTTWFFSLILLVFFLWQYSQHRKVALHYLDGDQMEHVLMLPQKDRKQLFGLMEKLFAEDHFAYTLLGKKPVSWSSYQAPFPFENWSTFFDSLKTHNLTMHLGWKTWRKYHHLFPSITFFLESPKNFSGSMSILLINEERFNSIIQENKKDFEDVLHRKIKDGSELFKETKNYSLMNDVLGGHQALMGIVLGYGRENSWKFLEKSEQKEPLGWVWSEAEYWSEQENTCEYSSSAEHNLFLYSCPSFAGIPTSEESLALKNDYLKTKKKVLEYYKDKDFLEATLSLLAGFRPEE